MEANGFQGQRSEWAQGGGLRLSCVTNTAGGTDDRHHSSPQGTVHCTIHLTERTSRDQTNTLSKGAPRNYYQAKTQTTQSQVLGTWLSSPVQKRRRGHSPLKTVFGSTAFRVLVPVCIKAHTRAIILVAATGVEQKGVCHCWLYERGRDGTPRSVGTLQEQRSEQLEINEACQHSKRPTCIGCIPQSPTQLAGFSRAPL